ncbi:hypothetical protein BDZ94DRAFT_934615 [Collybia nuda]|uniref:DUF1479-domain-containing protein n=1 Tax=Collybia nuda TaxID=64659 RepID=A0A9P5Y2N8_9AGAR|nr:hypothetical protein BDZ94DRAFT_934615 [Collybia nuda]
MSLPARFSDLKREIAAAYPDFEERATRAWIEIIEQLKEVTADISNHGVDYIPQVNYSDLETLSKEDIDKIKRRGCVVIRDIVNDTEAKDWKTSLEDYITANPGLDGYPANNPIFYEIFWTKAQLQARSHPNILSTTLWLTNLYHIKGESVEGMDLSNPLSYADRFRIRRPGPQHTNILPPHVDGPTIERWEDPALREYFSEILSGNWHLHDPYEMGGRIKARNSHYERPNQASIFRSFQGWLALSETGPTEGTIQFFPSVALANAYIILRPFFRPLPSADATSIMDAKNWEFDISSPDFPGIHPLDGGYIGPRPTPALHPHLRLETTMTSVPKMRPGDAVFWHCDVIHAVEEEHKGQGDSAVIFIPAVPQTPYNQAYVEKQRETFLSGRRPPDMPQGKCAEFPEGKREDHYVGFGTLDDISLAGRKAMGFPVGVVQG